MPDLEDLIRSMLDRQAPLPDPDPIVERVAHRKRQVRLARRVQSATLAVVVVAGIAAGGYALARAFGVGREIAPVATPSIPGPTASAPTPTNPGPTPSPSIVACGDATGSLALVFQEGAAGTIRHVWGFTTTAAACRSTGYPTIEVRGPSGWLSPLMAHGGFADINGRPKTVSLQPGQSLFFVTYWNDIGAGSCVTFDRVRVTLPGSSSSVEIASSGCLGTQFDGTHLVRVGPVTGVRPG